MTMGGHEMPNDGFDSGEYAEHMELRSLLGKLRLPDDFDPYRVIRTPSEDRTRDTIHVTFRMSKHLHRQAEQLYGHGRRFQNRTEFILHYIAVGFMVERGLAAENDAIRSLLDATISKIELDDQKANDDAIDWIIQHCDLGLASSEGIAKSKMLIELQRVKRICENAGYTRRVKKIDEILGREP